jgi:hypothetical protein
VAWDEAHLDFDGPLVDQRHVGDRRLAAPVLAFLARC